MTDHTVEDLLRKIGTDWVRMPEGTNPKMYPYRKPRSLARLVRKASIWKE